jgi:PucR C-terminal helix-turn-helix domain/GGDEF-like domain
MTMADSIALSEISRLLRPRSETLAEYLLPLYQAEIPQYAHAEDPHLLADMTAISLSALGCWLDVLENEPHQLDENLLGPVLDVIRRRALQGLGLDAMMRAYRIAARVVWQEILNLPIRQELIAPLSTRLLDFTDQLTTAAEQAYATEILRTIHEPELTNSALFESVLAGRTPQLTSAATWLANPHCVVVLEIAPTAPAGSAAPTGSAASAARAAAPAAPAGSAGSAARAAAPAALTAPVGSAAPAGSAGSTPSAARADTPSYSPSRSSTSSSSSSSSRLDDLATALVRESRAAYWTTRARPNSVIAACPIDGADGRDVLIRRLARFTNARRPLSVAIGGIGEGASGTRHSYREALDAMYVGEHLAADEPRRIHDSQELAPLAVMVSDPDRAERFAHGCLFPLGRLVERSWVLPTLAAYLKCQGRLKEVAAELAVHPSTVKYRLNELRPFLDTHAADGDQAAALLLAVRICEYFADLPTPPTSPAPPE